MSLSSNTVGQRPSFLVTTTVFGPAKEVTFSELTLETFFPANADTAAAIQTMAEGFA